MEAAGDIAAADQRENGRIVSHDKTAVAFSHIAIDVYLFHFLKENCVERKIKYTNFAHISLS